MAKKSVTLPDVEHSDIEILKFFLKVLYGHDCDGLALRLVERFGSFGGVFKATYEELISVPNVTERVASFFTLMLPLNRQALLRSAVGMRIISEAALARFVTVFFLNERNPLDVYLYLDKNYKILGAERSVADDKPREIVSGVCRYDATKLIFVRYYPREHEGRELFTIDRLELLKNVAVPLSTLKVELVDYIEYTPFKVFSLRRAADGDECMLAVSSVSEDAYKTPSGMFDKACEYYRVCVERLDAELGS